MKNRSFCANSKKKNMFRRGGVGGSGLGSLDGCERRIEVFL